MINVAPTRSNRGGTTESLRRSAEEATALPAVMAARARLVGGRSGLVADLVIALVRAVRLLQRASMTALRAASSVITALGWSLLVIAPLALLAGFAWGWLELVVAGAMVLVLILAAVLYLVGRTRLDVQLIPPPSRVAVGDNARAVLRVSNPTRRRSLTQLVDVPVGLSIVPVTVPGLAPGRETQLEVVIPTDRRGRLIVGPVRTERADPIGIVRREVVWTAAREIIVHPRTIDIPSTSSGLVRDLEGQPTRDLTPSDLAFHALREYVPGDDRRHIHWKSSAKTGSLMVRQFEETRRSRIAVVMGIASVDFGSDDEFELAVSVTGSVGARAIRDNRELSVIVSALTPEFAKRAVVAVRRVPTLTPTRLLDDLAVIAHGPSALGILDVARLAGDETRGVSVAFLVVGSTVTPSRLRSAAAGFPPSVEVVVLQCDPEHIPGRRRLGAFTVITIGSLSDLRRAMRGAEAW